MILAEVETWPLPLLEYLASQHEMLLAHARHHRKTIHAYLNPTAGHVPMALMPSNPHIQARERATLKILQLVQSTTLRGWHCTRLTDQEVKYIMSHGMQPPNLQVLCERIRRLEADGVLSNEIAERLVAENQADDDNRRGMIWFCFFEPRLADQWGIERFFRCWGGEALYNSHEDDPITGNALRIIGRPCLIEADVPFSSFGPYTYLGDKVIRRYLITHSFDTGEDCDLEDRTSDRIPAANIVRVVSHDEPEFANLTGCDLWDPPLDVR
jgi:hypothetical protein